MGEILLWALAIIGALVVILAVLIYLGRRKSMKQQAAAAKTEPVKDPLQPEFHASNDPRKIEVGSTLEIMGQVYQVRGSFSFTDGAYSWKEHLLERSGGGRYWLYVELNGDLEMVLYEDITDTAGVPEPATKMLVHDTVQYARYERGKARYTAVGATDGLPDTGQVEFIDYRGPKGRRLSYERFGDRETWEVSVGLTVSMQTIQVYPASQI